MPKTVLLADDSITIQKVVGISFASEDVKLVSVDNGEAAVAKARELRPDLVLADVVMPGLSGYEVCEALKGDPALRHIPVLLLTGTFEAFDEERARRCGAAGHVAKPFEAQTLVEQVKRLLAAPQARPAPPAGPRSAAAAPRPAAPAAGRPAAPPSPRHQAPPEAKAGPPAPPPSPEPSFDFFEEPAGDLSPEPIFETGAQARDLPFEDSGDSFSFGDEELGSRAEAAPGPALAAPARRPAGRSAEATVAILPDPEPSRRAAPLRERELVLEAEPEAAGGDPRGLATLAAELLEDDTGPAAPPTLDDPFAPDSLASAPFEAPEREREGQVTELFDLGMGNDPADSLLRGEDADLAKATVLDPDGATGFDVSASDLGEAFASPAPRPPAAGARRAPAAPSRPSPAPATSAPPPASPTAREVVRELTPRLRDPLHDTLEKIAWESFGSMTEEIVRGVVARIEAVAWEVIPQMAETLIREELRRIKGEGEDPEF
jgi:CheY-like chemotaxis protein